MQTTWGEYLLNDLKQYISLHIEALERHMSVAIGLDGMEKPVELFRQTVEQLCILRDSKTWDDVICNKNIDYGRLTFGKKCSDLEIAEKMKEVNPA